PRPAPSSFPTRRSSDLRTFRRFECRSPARFKAAELLDPLVECEFFVTLARDLPPRQAPWTLPEVTDAIAEVHAGIEVAECRYRRDRKSTRLNSSHEWIS